VLRFVLNKQCCLVSLQVLCSFARHFKTGEPLPEDTIIQLCQTKKMFSASVSIVQSYGMKCSLYSHFYFNQFSSPYFGFNYNVTI